MRQRLIVQTVVLSFMLLAAITLLNRINLANLINPIIRGGCCLLVLVLLISQRSIAHYFSRLPKPHKIVVVSLFVLIFVGHYIHRQHTTFPFIHWPMYGQPLNTETATFYHLIGVDDNDQRRMLVPIELFPSLAHGRIHVHLRGAINKVLHLESTTDGEKDQVSPRDVDHRQTKTKFGLRAIVLAVRKIFTNKKASLDKEQAKSQLNQTLLAIGQMHNRKNPHAQIEAIGIRKGTVNFEDKPVPRESYEVIWHFDLKQEGVR